MSAVSSVRTSPPRPTLDPAPTIRPLGDDDRDDVLRIAERAGVHGIYVRNSVLTGGEEALRIFGFATPGGGLDGLGWHGRRGNLIVLVDNTVDPRRFAAELAAQRAEWRICLGPAEVVAAILATERRTPLVDRDQVYYAIEPGSVAAGRVRDDVRLAARDDVRALVEASIDLNQSDLNVPAWRVQRSWLRDSVRRRIREQGTWVIGPHGQPVCKLDVGSAGPAGFVIEGVHTVPSARSRGLATGLVASVASQLLRTGPCVCLHVGAANYAARRAYEAAGMVERGRCRILLRG